MRALIPLFLICHLCKPIKFLTGNDSRKDLRSGKTTRGICKKSTRAAAGAKGEPETSGKTDGAR